MATASWTFLTSHTRVLLCIAHDPGVRPRDIAAKLDITERSAYGIVTDLARAGYIVKQKDGRRNRYQIQAHLPLPEPCGCRKPCHLMRPGHIRGSVRRADPCAGCAYWSFLWVGGRARRAGSAAAPGAAGGCCRARRARPGPAAGAVRW